MAFTWVEARTNAVQWDANQDVIITGSGTLSAGDISNSPVIRPSPYGSVQVLVTSGAVSGQIESSNDDTNYAAGYDASGAVRPALFSGLSASRNFDDPGFPAYKSNRLKLTAGAAGFAGTVIIYLTRRAG